MATLHQCCNKGLVYDCAFVNAYIYKLHTQSHLLHFKLLKACSPHIAHSEYGECRSVAGMLSDPGQDHRHIEALV